MLAEGGIDLVKDQVNIAPVPGATGPGVSFGVTAAKALEEGKLDGFWANGMGAEVAVTRGVGTIVVDVRRGDGPKAAFGYTQPALVATDKLIKSNPDAVAAAVRALVATHKTLKADVSQATAVGRKRFPDYEAGLIAELIRRDLPYYDASISQGFVQTMCAFSRDMGKLASNLSYDQVVATQFAHLWKA
jgi:ABC-type nitrate/sulfonate/bicarbonate transport system substrate-binding protein